MPRQGVMKPFFLCGDYAEDWPYHVQCLLAVSALRPSSLLPLPSVPGTGHQTGLRTRTKGREATVKETGGRDPQEMSEVRYTCAHAHEL